MKKHLSFSIPVLFTVILFTGCKSEIKTENEPVIVEVMRISPVPNTQAYQYTGTIEESYSSMISFQVAGNIRQIYCEENQHVSKGTLLASLDKTVHQNSYDIALSTYKQAEDAYRRLKQLYDDNSLPEIQWIEAQTALQNAESMLNIARNNLDNCNLFAPFSGIIAKRITEVGANVMPGIPVFNLVKMEKIKVKAPVPEKEVSQIQIGQQVKVKVSALADDNEYMATVSEKSALANPLSHTYDIKIELDNPSGKLLPGMICDISILQDNGDDEQIIVPNHAVMLDNTNNRFVWKVENNTAYKQSIQVDKLAENGVIIQEGLISGDEIIVNGNQKVSAGTTIKRK